MAQGTYKTGKVVRVALDTNYQYAASGSVQRSVDVDDVTNAESNGYQELERGIFRASGDCTLKYKGADPPAIDEGDEVVVDLVMGTSSKRYSTSALVTQITDSWAVNGAYGVSFNWQSTGVYYTYAPA